MVSEIWPSPQLGVSRMEQYRQTTPNAIEQATSVAQILVQPPITDAMWRTVASVLGVIQNADQISKEVVRMVLTRDRAQDLAQRNALHAMVAPALMQTDLARNPALREAIDYAYDELVGISVLGPLWRDDEITEILVDSWDRVAVERNGRLFVTPLRFRDADHARKVARDLALKVSDRALTPANPLVTAELPGARVTFAIDKVVKTGIAVSIRKFRPLMGIEGLMGAGAFNTEIRDFLADCVQARANILVSGGTGTGKTTMINALSSFIPDAERVITIEDAYELKLTNTHWVALQTKEASSSDDTVHISMADLLVATLRMRPDRVIVGEIREPNGAAVMLQAANTGHDGTMTTIHANSAERALNFRLVGLARTGAGMGGEVAAAEVASAINLVLQVVRRNNKRFVSEIAVVDPSHLHGAMIKPDIIFRGELVDIDGVVTPRFARYGGVRADTELGMKLEDSGLLARWQE